MKKSAVFFVIWAAVMFAYVLASNYAPGALGTPVKVLFIIVFAATFALGVYNMKKEKEEAERLKMEKEQKEREERLARLGFK